MKVNQKFLPPLFLAVPISAALDIGLAASQGYGFRANPVLLIAADVVLLSLAVAVVYSVMRLTGILPRVGVYFGKAVWFSVLFAAWAPVGAGWFWHERGLRWWAVQTAVAAILFFVALLEVKGRIPAPRWKALSVAWVGFLAVASVAVSYSPLPGAGMLEPASRANGTSPSPDAPNVLLIVLDTMRADRLEAYGNRSLGKTWLGRFAESATVYENVVADSSFTLPSHASLFTGLYSRAHGAHTVTPDTPGSLSSDEVGWLGAMHLGPLVDEAVTLAEILRGEGFETAAICANAGYLHHSFGLDQGFDTYVDARGSNREWRPAGLRIGNRLPYVRPHPLFARLVEGNEIYYLLGSEVNELALKWLRARPARRFFLFLNYMEAHDPYWAVGESINAVLRGDPHRKVDYAAVRSEQREIYDEERTLLFAAYEAEIRYLDRQLESLFDELKRLGALKNTLVVFVGDHGESFGEHYKLDHQTSVYQSEVHVPLFIRDTGQTRGERNEQLAHIADVFPSILTRLGIHVPTGIQGAVLGSTERPYPVVTRLGKFNRDYAEDAIYDWPWKLILTSEDHIELYNLAEDPAELHDMTQKKVDLANRLVRELVAYKETVKPRFRSVALEMDQEAIDRLKSLGYLD